MTSTGGRARVLIMTADASAADEITKVLEAMASNEKFGFSKEGVIITVISRMEEFEKKEDLRDFDVIITDRTVICTKCERDVVVHDAGILWDVRRGGLHVIETFRPTASGHRMSEAEARRVASDALRKLRASRKR